MPIKKNLALSLCSLLFLVSLFLVLKNQKVTREDAKERHTKGNVSSYRERKTKREREGREILCGDDGHRARGGRERSLAMAEMGPTSLSLFSTDISKQKVRKRKKQSISVCFVLV